MMSRAQRESTHDRLLKAATELFYSQGVQRSTVDAVADAAGHAKPTLYNLFGSKENLLRLVLERRFEQRRQALERLIDDQESPRERLSAVLKSQAEAVGSEGFRGCPLVNAAVELPNSEASRDVTRRYKRWYRKLLVTLATEGGLRDPNDLAATLLLLIEGANVLAYVEDDPSVGWQALRAGEAIIRQHEPTQT